MKGINILAYVALALVASVLLASLGGLVYVSFSRFSEPKNDAKLPKVPPVATRQVVNRIVDGVEEEIWIVKTDKSTLNIPKKLVGPHDADRGFYHLGFVWPGLIPMGGPAGGRSGRDSVDVLLQVKREFPPRAISEQMREMSERYGKPVPARHAAGMEEYLAGFKGRRELIAVDVSPTVYPLEPFFVSCSNESCRAYVHDIYDAHIIIDFHAWELPNAQRLFRDVFTLLLSFYEK